MSSIDYRRLPCLIQRMTLKREPDVRYQFVDRYFSMDYMGSAEFEFGTLPKALRDMSENASSLSIEEHSHGLLGVSSLWVVANSSGHQSADMLLQRELDRDNVELRKSWYLKESTRMFDALGLGDARGLNAWASWWAIDGNDPFAIFQAEPAALLWITSLKLKAKHSADMASGVML